MKGNFRTIDTVCIAAILALVATGVPAFAGPSPSDQDQFFSMTASSPPWNGEATEWEWSPSRPAAKAARIQANCLFSELASLEGDDLVRYLRTHSGECLQYSWSDCGKDPPTPEALCDYLSAVPSIFSDRNMQAVSKAIGDWAMGQADSNNAGLFQLWSFVWAGYRFQRWHPDWIGEPFDEETNRAYFAASDAFSASDHFLDFEDADITLRLYFGILWEYFNVSRSQGGEDSLQPETLVAIKRVLTGVTSEMVVESGVWWRVFNQALGQISGGISHDRRFTDALKQDQEILDVLLQATRHDFLHLEGMEEDGLRTLERIIRVLGEMTDLDGLEEEAVEALRTVLSEQERLSIPFMVAVEVLEDQVDCSILNICRDQLKQEILAKILPNTYRFEDGAFVFQTSLDPEEAQSLYYSAKEVEAQFHRLIEANEEVRDGKEVLTARIYGTNLEYDRFESYLFGLDSGGLRGVYVYWDATLVTWLNRAGSNSRRTREFEEVFRHEYTHYLADRFLLLSFGGALTWFHEGLADFLVGSTRIGGIPVRRSLVEKISNDETRFDLAQIIDSRFGSLDVFGRFYDYGALLFSYLYQHRRSQLLELLDLVRTGNETAYQNLMRTWKEDTHMAADYSSFLDEQVADRRQLVDPPITNPFLRLEDLFSNSAEEVEGILGRIDGELDLDCRTVVTGSFPRFGCSGTLSADDQFSGDRGALNEHLNDRLDGFMADAVENGEINNFEDMTCHFTNVTGSPAMADIYCEGPLRPLDLPPPGVDLMAILRNDSKNPVAHAERSVNLYAGLRIAEDGASNVMLTWSASLPLDLEEVLMRGTRIRCREVETEEREGTLACGDLLGGNTEMGLSLIFTPLQAGTLEFSVVFSADEREIEPADNSQSLQWVISPAPYPRTLATMAGDDQMGPAGEALSEPIEVTVLDQNGDPFPGAVVTFAVTAGGGRLSATTATTDSSGRASATLTLGRNPGTNTVTATVGDLEPLTFSAVGIAVPRTLTIVSGDDQQGPLGTPLGDPLVVAVLDQNGSPYAGAAVTFRVTSGDGTVSVLAARTDAGGRASTALTLGGLPGANTVEVTVADLDPVSFTAVAKATPDFDGDGVTSFADFFLFADAFGGTDPRFDLDGSGVVDFGDFFIFADAFGQPARAKLLALAAELIGLPEGPQLQQNAPNPFNSQTVIPYFLLAPGPARLDVYALTGQRVAVLHQGPQPAGLHRLHWDGRGAEGRPLASGIYLYRLVTAEGALSRKLVLLR